MSLLATVLTVIRRKRQRDRDCTNYLILNDTISKHGTPSMVNGVRRNVITTRLSV